MRQHNGVILVTEPVSIVQFSLDTTPQGLPSPPTGDIGRQILQVTLRSADSDWEWRPNATTDYFFMSGLDIVVMPIRDRVALEEFQFRAVSANADMRVIYEC